MSLQNEINQGVIPPEAWDMVDKLVRKVNELEGTKSEGEGGDASHNRVNATNAVASPYVISWASHPVGTRFTDVGAVAATGWLLPTAGSFPGNVAKEVPHYCWVNTSGQDTRIIAGSDSTIQVDESTASAAGGHVDLLSNNGTTIWELIDNRWRATGITGEWSVDA